MNNQAQQPTGHFSSYITSATPNPPESARPGTPNTATDLRRHLPLVRVLEGRGGCPSTRAGCFRRVGWAIVSLVLAALICHFLFYLVPGLLGMKTGLPLYIVGTFTFGAQGGFLMPGFLMGVLQFGWLGVNVFAPQHGARAEIIGVDVRQEIIMVLWGLLAGFVGIKGIQYVAKVATYLPLIPLAILLFLLAKTAGTIADFDPQKSSSPCTKHISPKRPAGAGHVRRSGGHDDFRGRLFCHCGSGWSGFWHE